MDGADTKLGFEEALKEVEEVVTAFNAAEGDERKSQDAKNSALYAALDRAFQFHRSWHGTRQYATLLEARRVNAKPRGANASAYIPTIKAFFDPTLDRLQPSDDAAKADKSRRQKMVSTYSKVLEFAASSDEGVKDVAAFIQARGGIEAARTEWTSLKKLTPEAKAKADETERATQQKLADGFGALKSCMVKALPQDDARQDSTALAAIYYDKAGVGHFLGLLPDGDRTATLLEKFLLDAAPKAQAAKGNASASRPEQGLDKLLALLAIGKVAHPKDANVKIINGPDRCELWSSHGSTQTCMVHAVLDRQEYLPEGAYWFGAKAIKAMQQLAKLGRHGAKFSISGPMEMDGKTAVVKVTVAGHEDAITGYNTKAGMVSWDWLDAIPDGNARCRTNNNDGTTTIAFRSATEKLAVAKTVDEWVATVAVEGGFAEWLDQTLSITKKDADSRLVKGVYGGPGGKLTTFRISGDEWALMAGHEDVASYQFAPALKYVGGLMEFTAGRGELLAARKAVGGLVPAGTLTISLIEKFMRVRCEANGHVAEVFIPSFTAEGRYEGHTQFLR